MYDLEPLKGSMRSSATNESPIFFLAQRENSVNPVRSLPLILYRLKRSRAKIGYENTTRTAPTSMITAPQSRSLIFFSLNIKWPKPTPIIRLVIRRDMTYETSVS